ncbi:hypothetical protein A3860_07090 [Niastella vici]|uniref:Uncharacterized protein n=1 Tax=Niastella vici TaxID=1703345 RepID=A0A1V9FIP2_9BACT|nr:hypothetical protein [Niastella vici]OQP58086.1 hypothetical protein A3860_07090 [Niastella vici]
MDSQEKELYREEVLELTELLNSEWEDLRELLVESNVNLKGAYLAGYFEDEDEGAEHGVILTADKKLIRFVALDGEITLEPVQDQAALEDEFPSVTVALEL